MHSRLKPRILRSLLIAGVLLGSGRAAPSQDLRVPLVDVPFMAQTEDLCGGAVAAMVLRYWGVRDVQASDFSVLVDRSKGGIAAGDLVRSIASRGFAANPIRAERADAVSEISKGRPLIALIDGGSGRLHYVVIVAWAGGRVLFHDPSVGPFRVRTEAEFLYLWNVTNRWALVLTPSPTQVSEPVRSAVDASANPTPASPCSALVASGVATARSGDPELAVPAFVAATEICPQDGAGFAALAGVRFRQERWKDAIAFARQATERDSKDADSFRLVATSLYLADDPAGALEVWNRVGEPRIDRVQVDGLVRTRQDIATAALGLVPRDILTSRSLALARRRLEQLPTASGPKVSFRPLPNGQANAIASVGERGLFEPLRVLGLRMGVEAAARRESSLQIHSPTSRGEAIEVGGRFAQHRPSIWVSLRVPRFSGLPGVVTLGGLWDRQTYSQLVPALAPEVEQTRRRGAINWDHWATPRVRIETGVGVDRFSGSGTYASVRGGVELRDAHDHFAVSTDGASWSALGTGQGFAEFGASLAFRSAVEPRRMVFTARADGRRATDDAPLAIWPGAGTGPGRPFLLRGSKLIQDGRVAGDAFGRGLLHFSAEAEVALKDLGTARLGAAAFADWAKPWDTRLATGAASNIFAYGLGLRLRALHTLALRVDVAKRHGRDGLVYSAGLIPIWPK